MATENALLDESFSETAESARGGRVRELLRLLVKAQKAQRLYEGKNAVSERLEKEFYERLTDFLETDGEIQLAVHEFELKCEHEIVYESHDRKDSLAFFLYRDGLRRLSLHPGVERTELTAFLTCLNRVALHANDQDDLVTLLWERDFHGIRYFAVEELATTALFPRLEEQLASGELSCGGAEEAEAMSLDLDQPVSSVPVETCRLDEGEIEALQAELVRESAIPFETLVTELAIELTLLEENETERDELIESLVRISDRLISEGALGELAAMVEHMDGLATMAFKDDLAVERFAATFLNRLGEPERLARFFEKVDEHHSPKPGVLTAYLARFASLAAETLLPWMGRLSSSAYRRAVTTAVLATEDGGRSVLSKILPVDSHSAGLEYRQYLREFLHAISHHPGEHAIPLLTRLLETEDVETRRESFVALSRYPDPEVDDLSLERLGDPDPEIRAAALNTLVRRGRQELGEKILEQSLTASNFDARSLNEKRCLFAAVAKLCGESVLDLLNQQLMGKEIHWFTSKKDKEFAEAVAHGIRVVGTPKAKEYLQHGSEDGARFVRAACAKELEH